MAETLFIVDDSDTNLATAKEALENHYRVMTMPSAGKMFSLLGRLLPDLILLDIEMPDMDGMEALEALKEHPTYSRIPVIFVTARDDVAAEARGFELGAVDFVTKPFSPPVLLNRVRTHLAIDILIRERTALLWKLQNGIVSVLSDMVESRDISAAGHVDRITAYVSVLIDAMAARAVYSDELADWGFEMAASSARLHDIGKISVSDLILNKQGKLTNEEYEQVKTHAEEGGRIIDKIVAQTGDKTFLQSARLFALYHHERWDGTGYPFGLAGTNIPLQGRIMALVDVYDALISERPYKKSVSHDEAVRVIMLGAGGQFDPDIAAVFYAVKDQFKAVAGGGYGRERHVSG